MGCRQIPRWKRKVDQGTNAAASVLKRPENCHDNVYDSPTLAILERFRNFCRFYIFQVHRVLSHAAP